MNAILAYAIEHQGYAKRLLISKGVPLDDMDDVVQEALIKVLRADPPHPDGTHADNPKGYWALTIITTAASYWRRYRERFPLDFEKADPSQDPHTITSQRETIREAWGAASPSQRRAIVKVLTQDSGRLSSTTKTALHYLRKRLREEAAV